MPKKTLLVGLDAACWPYLDPLLKQGRLPALEKLMAGGSWGTLMSTLPASTPVAWASIITGKNPGKHGVFDMMRRVPGSYKLSMTHARVRRGKPFWQHLNEHGVRVGLVNIPFTHPPDPIDGFIVCGFGAAGQTDNLTFPPEVLDMIESSGPRYEPVVDSSAFSSDQAEELLAAESDHQTRQVEIALMLAKRFDVQVLAINLMLPDHANHKFPDIEQVNQAIILSDKDVERLIQGFGPDNIMLISDHGSRRIKGDFLLGAWLKDHGYSFWNSRPQRERSQALNWILMEWLQKDRGWSGQREKIGRNILRRLIAAFPQPKGPGLFWAQVEKSVPFARDHVYHNGKLDYSRSRIFFGNRASGTLYINAADREPSGIVPAEQRDALINELSQALMQVKDPVSDQPLLSGVYRREDLYHGPALSDAPDLVIDGYEADWNIATPYRWQPVAEMAKGRYFLPNRGTFGWHGRDGIFAFSGIDFIRTNHSTGRSVLDIPATLLQLYGVPIPEDFDGHVMVETIEPEFFAEHPIRAQAAESEIVFNQETSLPHSEEVEILNHLRALGYVD